MSLGRMGEALAGLPLAATGSAGAERRRSFAARVVLALFVALFLLLAFGMSGFVEQPSGATAGAPLRSPQAPAADSPASDVIGPAPWGYVVGS